MNIFRLYLNYQIVCILLAVFLVAGCLPNRNAMLAKDQNYPEYQSEVTIPEAKSTYAYGQYRLLASEGRWDEALDALERAVALDSESKYLQMNLARAYLHNTQQEKSIQVLQDLLQQYPDYVEGHELIGDLFLHQELAEDAVGHYRLALELKGQDDPLRLKLALALARQGDYSSAIAEASSLLKEKPESLSTRLTLARFYKEDQQFSRAVTAYRELLDRKPGQLQVLLELGRLLEQQDQPDEALKLYQDGIDQEPRAVAVRDQMARLLVAENRYAEALQLLQELNDLHPDKTQILGRIGLLQLEMKQWAEAELTFRKLLRVDSNHERSRYYLGLALSGSGDYHAALQELATVSSESDVYLESVTQRAYLHQKYNQPQKAIELLHKVLESGLNDPIIYYYLSSSLVSLEQLVDAEEVLRSGIELHPENVNLRYQLGVVYEKMERREEAGREMDAILEIDPDHADALNYIAYLKAESGEDLDQALIEAKRALAIKEEGYILDTLGWIYFKLGRYEEGRKSLEKASRLQPEDTVVLEHLGDLYRALMLWSEAAEAYRQILELDPVHEGIREKLEALPDGYSQ